MGIGHHAQLDLVPIKEVEQCVEHAQLPSQPIDAVDQDVVNVALLNIPQQPPQCRSVE
jgi:hypothetical protein